MGSYLTNGQVQEETHARFPLLQAVPLSLVLVHHSGLENVTAVTVDQVGGGERAEEKNGSCCSVRKPGKL